MNPDTCGRANSIWIRIRVDVQIFESAKKNLRIQKYPDTSGRGLKVRSHCHFDKVWQRYSCDNGKQNCQKVCCTFRYFFLFISQTCCMLKLFFIFTLHSPLSWLFELPSSVTMQNNHWYATISLKADDLMGKGRRKRRPQLLANREARIWKQLNLLSRMLATILTKYCGSFAFKNPPSELELCV